MKRGQINWFSLVVSFFAFLLLCASVFVSVWTFGLCGNSFKGCLKVYFCFDAVSAYLVVLTSLMGLCLAFLNSWVSKLEFVLMMLSHLFAILSYVCCHIFFFWVFYEMSIVLLLYLIFSCSPYSERYSAFWYFLLYLVASSMPMFFVVCRLIMWSDGSESCVDWKFGNKAWESLILLLMLFATKIPLFPFTGWLPVVHAESSSLVSVCLSGYMMKLGVLGLVRLCYWVTPDHGCFYVYSGYLVLIGCIYFVCSSSEVDKKRWLAYLSLSHIVMVPLCLEACDIDNYEVAFSYCLGHGLSASVAFMYFWLLSCLVGSRSWVFMKSGLSDSFYASLFMFSVVCFCGSLPFCLQFFCELYAICMCSEDSYFLFVSLVMYLYVSALVPLSCLGHILTRSLDIRPSFGSFKGPFLVIFFLVLVNAYLFLLY